MTEQEANTPATPAEAKAALEKAYELGHQAGAAQAAPETYEFSNGALGAARGSEYETALQELVRELRAAGARGNLSNVAEVVSLRARYGR
ncbi:MAG: hypothetical protein IIA89_13425 [Chloroflexi bacterium]|nr:hypothetical protein [Chloroflexota bacterium]